MNGGEGKFLARAKIDKNMSDNQFETLFFSSTMESLSFSEAHEPVKNSSNSSLSAKRGGLDLCEQPTTGIS
jgi:hypothetical protein